MIDIPYASTAKIVREVSSMLRPRVRISVSQYAVRHRKLANHGGGKVGDWSHDDAPYLVEPMDCLDLPGYLTVAVVGPGQSGKTSIAQNWLLKAVGGDPADMLWYMQTEPGLEAFVKGQINPMIESHEPMASRLGRRPTDDSIHFKRFYGMRLELLSAAYSNLISKSAPRIVADEVDAWPKSLGDIKALLDIRRQTFGRHSKLLAISHPDRAQGLNPETDWLEGIMAIYGDSDRRVWYWACPHCGAWSSPVPTAARVMTIDYPSDAPLDVIEREARLCCPSNGCLIEDSYRREMNRYGRWIGSGQEINEDGVVSGELIRSNTAGFWIVGAMSLFAMGGIGGLARARVKAEREAEASGDDLTIRQVLPKQWGIPAKASKTIGSIDATVIADRAELELLKGIVPSGVRFLTAAVDSQIAHFEYLVRGWGIGGESWIVDWGRIAADPATLAEDWDKLLEAVFAMSYPLDDDTGRRMPIRGGGYDSGGAPGVTQQAYSAWMRWKKSQRLKMYGHVGGRDVWSVLPMKGATSLDAQRVSVSYPDTVRRANVQASAGSVPLAKFNPNLFKDDLVGQLGHAEAGQWAIHFPYALRSKEGKPPHPWFEQLTSEQRGRDGRWEKKRPGVRNEALDLMVMTHALAHLHGIARIDWERAPTWAQEWDRNPSILAAQAHVVPVISDRSITSPTVAILPASTGTQRKSIASRLA